MGFTRQEYWSGLPFPSPGYLPNSGIKPRSPIRQVDSLRSEPPGKSVKFDDQEAERTTKSFFNGNCSYPVHWRLITLSWKWKVKVKVAQCPTLCDPMDYPIQGILQARTLEWVTFPFSRGSSQSRNQTRISCIAGGFFINWAMREAMSLNIFHRVFIVNYQECCGCSKIIRDSDSFFLLHHP